MRHQWTYSAMREAERPGVSPSAARATASRMASSVNGLGTKGTPSRARSAATRPREAQSVAPETTTMRCRAASAGMEAEASDHSKSKGRSRSTAVHARGHAREPDARGSPHGEAR